MSVDVSLAERLAGPPRGGRYASLEGYRGIAATTVLVFHVWLLTWPPRRTVVDLTIGNMGQFGVAVFFVLSGTVLFLPIARALLSGVPAPPAGRFLLRRFLRIYPAFWLAITGWALVVPEARRAAVDAVRVFLLVDADERSLGVAWTLHVELLFYLFVAALGATLIAACRRWRPPPTVVLRVLLGVLAAMAVYASVFRLALGTDFAALVRHHRSFSNHVDWFALGMLLAVGAAWQERGGRIPRAVRGIADRELACLALAAGCYGALVAQIVATDGRPFTQWSYELNFVLQGMAAFFLLLPAVLGERDQAMQRMLRRPVLAALGTVSYGIYLWHFVVLLAVVDQLDHARNWWALSAQVLMVFAVTVVIATISHRFVERPAMALAGERDRPLVHSGGTELREQMA